MPETKHCPRCGSPLSGDSASATCPACLLEQGLPGHSAAGDEPRLLTTVAHTGPLAPNESATPNTPTLPKPGDEFGGYLIIRPLGRGGMGTVYEAEQLDSGRRVALKLLSHSLDSPEARKRFFREGRLAASVNHPHSVYIFGTEEIQGTPVISMEFAPGGTLQERVRQKGPLPVAEAVDAVLQVIAGLEAAQSLGVLHRDVKPSNCFVDIDGGVKIGDFGLSISTAVRGESQITSSGVFLGTPGFSSPEQLKGDELDVRSDIYAVGVTLYYLLTGRTPFEADNLVKLLATVLEQAAPSPLKWRADIPGDLTQVLLCCLEKQPAKRFKNYAELRAALRPFSSEMPTPARLSLRFAAGLIDLSAASLLPAAVLYPFGVNLFAPVDFHTPQCAWRFLSGLVFYLLYYAVPEGLWGASFGKWLCRLRVVDENRNSPGLFRAVVRMGVYVVLPALPMWIDDGLNSGKPFAFERTVLQLRSLSYLVMLALLFSTARRRNGFTGLQDLASRTRVIARPVYEERPRLAVEDEHPPTPSGSAQIGPYHVLESLGPSGHAEWLLANDTRLLRKVWICRLPSGAPRLPPALRNVVRIGRLRWLGGKRSGEECWDAFEAATGAPLLMLLGEPQSWGRVRYWLFDLAKEMALGLADRTLPAELGLDRVWITGDGRAKLFDFPVPRIGPVADETTLVTEPGDVGAATQFLHQLALAALEGRDISAADAARLQVRLPLPLHALPVLQGIPQVQRLEVLVAQLQPVLHKSHRISRCRRTALLVACLFLPTLASSFEVFSGYMAEYVALIHPDESQMHDIQPLRDCLRLYTPTPFSEREPVVATTEQREAMEVYIAGRFGRAIRDPRVWSSSNARSTIPQSQRDAAERIVSARPQPTEGELRQATEVIRPLLENHRRIQPPPHKKPIFFIFGTTLIMFVALPSLAVAVLFRGGLLLAILGIGVVTSTGQRASRRRIFWRGLLAWSPVLLFPVLMPLLTGTGRYFVAGTMGIPLLIPLAGVGLPVRLFWAAYLALAIWSALLPDRGLPDRLAGTYLVPR